MDASPPQESSRRRFHLGIIYGLGSLIGSALGIPAAIYLLFPPRNRAKEDWIEVTDLSRLTPGQPEEITFRRSRKDGWKMVSERTSAWVTRSDDGKVIAFAPTCTHLGCAFHWDEQHKNYLCPCHTSTFDKEGKPLEGPAPRALDRYQTKVEGGKLLLGTIQKSES